MADHFTYRSIYLNFTMINLDILFSVAKTSFLCLLSISVIFLCFPYQGKLATLHFKGILQPWTLFLKTLYIFSENKAILD